MAEGNAEENKPAEGGEPVADKVEQTPPPPPAEVPAKSPTTYFGLFSRRELVLSLGGLLLILIFSAVLGAVIGHNGSRMVDGLRWGASQWGPVAGWASAIFATAAVYLSYRQAREAEKRSLRDIDERRKDDLRKREYEAVAALLRAARVLVTEVHSFIGFMEHDQKVTEILAKSDEMSEQDKVKIMFDSVNAFNDRKNLMFERTTGAVVDARLALFQLKDESLHEAASVVVQHMHATTLTFSAPEADNDWGQAQTQANHTNASTVPLQQAAGVRFRRKGDE